MTLQSLSIQLFWLLCVFGTVLCLNYENLVPQKLQGRCRLSYESGRTLCYPKAAHLDMSCNDQEGHMPHVRNATSVTQTYEWGERPSQIVEYHCQGGHRLLDEASHLFCVQQKWIGTRPICVSKAESWQPIVVVSPDSRLHLRRGTNLTLNCETISQPPANLSWTGLKQGDRVSKQRSRQLVAYQRLSVDNIQEDRRIECVSRNGHFTTIQLIDLFVNPAPPTPPTNFRVKMNEKDKSVNIEWTPSISPERLDIVRYELDYKLKAGGGWRQVTTNSSRAQLPNIVPDQTYYFKVTAFDEKDQKAISQWNIFHTDDRHKSKPKEDKEILPAPEVKVKNDDLKPDSRLLVEWSLPEMESRNQIKEFLLFYQDSDLADNAGGNNISSWDQVKVNGDQTSTVLDKLQPSTEYLIRVRAVDADGQAGQLSQPVNGSTTETGAEGSELATVTPKPIPLKAPNFSAVPNPENPSNQILIEWDTDSNQPVWDDFYQILNWFEASSEKL